MASNEELREAVEDYRIIFGSFRKKRYNLYLEEVKAFEAEIAAKEKTSEPSSSKALKRPNQLRRIIWPLSIAASILALIYVGLSWYPKIYIQKVAKDAYEWPEDNVIYLGDQSTLFDTLNYEIKVGHNYREIIHLMKGRQGTFTQLEYYKAQSYLAIAYHHTGAQQKSNAALKILEDYPQNQAGYLMIQHILAPCYFAIGAYDKSAKAYDYVLNNNYRSSPPVIVGIDSSKLEWDRLLAYTAKGQFNPRYDTLLSKLVASKGPYQQKARSLKRKTEGFWRKWR
jgi:hypothetical protein